MSENVEISPLMRNIIRDIVETNLRKALIQKPVYTLREILAQKTVADLKELAKAAQTAGYGKMKKQELVDAVCESLPNQKYLEMALNGFEKDDWDFFKKTARNKQIVSDFIFEKNFHKPQSFGLLQAFFDEGKMIFVVPEEIRYVFEEMIRNGTAAKIERSVLIDCYARAAVNLYGVIPLVELKEIFNGQNAKKTTDEELYLVLSERIDEDSDYFLWEDYLVNWEFGEEGFKNIPAFENVIRGKERYIPPKNEFLKYADEGYYEHTPQTYMLETFINEMTQDMIEAHLITKKIALKCMAEARLKEIMYVFDKLGIIFEEEQLKRFLPILMDVYNNSRIWSNKGHTPNEIASAHAVPMLKVMPGGNKKPGRNDPCPCGSGKKYKNCCGRDG